MNVHSILALSRMTGPLDLPAVLLFPFFFPRERVTAAEEEAETEDDDILSQMSTSSGRSSSSNELKEFSKSTDRASEIHHVEEEIQDTKTACGTCQVIESSTKEAVKLTPKGRTCKWNA